MRIMTKENLALAKGEKPKRAGHRLSKLSGIVIDSAEGVRFAYTEVQLRTPGRNLANLALPTDLQELQGQRLSEIQQLVEDAKEE